MDDGFVHVKTSSVVMTSVAAIRRLLIVDWLGLFQHAVWLLMESRLEKDRV